MFSTSYARRLTVKSETFPDQIILLTSFRSIAFNEIYSLQRANRLLVNSWFAPDVIAATLEELKQKNLKPAAHESYLLSKNSLVTIGVSKFPHVR
jgi:hypothetical protein